VLSRLRRDGRIAYHDWVAGSDGRKRTIYALTEAGRVYIRKLTA
jgi:DNA-binding PadR family transcriptional regulator